LKTFQRLPILRHLLGLWTHV